MHIGLIGGIGPAATDYYYRGLIAAARAQGLELALTIVHADSPTLLRNQAEGNADRQVEIFSRLARRLQAAGADIVAVTAISGHFCIDAFAAASPLPVIDMLQAVDHDVDARGFRTLGIVGTGSAMTSRLYGGVSSARIVPPPIDRIAPVHDAYVAMATRGSATAAERELLFGTCDQLANDHGAEAIILAGTDLVLAFGADGSGYKVVDCAAIHVEAIARKIGG